MTSPKTVFVCLATLLLVPHVSGAQSRQSSAAARKAADCLAAAATGDQTFSCSGLRVDVHVPRSCAAGGCGLILEIHGDKGTGLLQDAHTDLRARGDEAGYILVAPTTPRLTWTPTDDKALVNITTRAIKLWRVDRAKVHVTGFSRGGYVTWRLLCDHADLFASAAPAAAGVGERSCFSGDRVPSRHVPILFLMGRADHQVKFEAMAAIRDAAIASYRVGPPQLVSSAAGFAHTRWLGADGTVIETFDHLYETAEDGPWGFARGHCIPGSRVDPHAPQYAIACKPPTGFVWGDEVMKFFRANPMR